MSILVIEDLHHDFSGLKVLMGVNLLIREGERHAIIGPNGAGKTTLFNVVTGMYRPEQREDSVQGKRRDRIVSGPAGENRHRTFLSDHEHLPVDDGVPEYPPCGSR